jgi:hypothetical protein
MFCPLSSWGTHWVFGTLASRLACVVFPCPLLVRWSCSRFPDSLPSRVVVALHDISPPLRSSSPTSCRRPTWCGMKSGGCPTPRRMPEQMRQPPPSGLATRVRCTRRPHTTIADLLQSVHNLPSQPDFGLGSKHSMVKVEVITLG